MVCGYFLLYLIEEVFIIYLKLKIYIEYCTWKICTLLIKRKPTGRKMSKPGFCCCCCLWRPKGCRPEGGCLPWSSFYGILNRIYAWFAKSHENFQTIRQTGSIGFESRTSRQPALREEPVNHWWGFPSRESNRIYGTALQCSITKLRGRYQAWHISLRVSSS